MNLSLLRFAFVALAALGLSARPAMAQATLLNTDLDALVRSGPALVGVSTTGAIVRSTNTTAPYTFTQVRATDSPRKVFALASSGNSVVAMGDAGHYAISTNAGLTFSTFNASVSPAFVGTINAVAFASSRWVAVGKRGNNIVGLTSTNGTTWAYATSMPSTPGELRALAWTGSRWVAVGGSTSAAGFALTSTDGATWTQLANSAYPFNLAPARLNAVATDGAGRVLAVGDAGTMLFSSNNGTTFTDAADNIVSEDLQSALFISGTQWVAGGNSAALVNYNASLGALGASLPFDPISGGKPIKALLLGTSPGQFLYANQQDVQQGPISLVIETVSNQLRLTLVGSLAGRTYFTETSTDLVIWTAVAGSTRTFDGTNAVIWTYALPAAGARVFYRAKTGSTP